MNPERAMRILRRRGPIVLICMLIVAGSAYAFAKHQPKRYTATASLLFTNDQLAAVATGLNPGSQDITQPAQDTNVQLVGLGDIAKRTAAQLGPGWHGSQVAAAMSIGPNSDTSIVEVSATTSTPSLAQRIANTYSSVFVSEQQSASVAAISAAQRLVNDQFKALTPVQRSETAGIALADRAQSLSILAKLQTGNVSIAGLASTPSSPSSPRTSRDTALGAILGLLIGVAIAFVLERFDRRIRDPKELEEIYGFPLLANVPERSQYEVLTTLGQAKGSGASMHDEVFNLLRSYLRYFSIDHELRTLLVISAGPGEGKTTVSYNLAKAAAALGSRVLLIEADLRRGTSIGPLIGRPDPGLSDVLIGDTGMEEAIHAIEIGPHAELHVLAAGELPPPNPGELIESQAMEGVLERATSAYDLVVIDTPPLNLIADAIPLLAKVDGVIVVGRIGTGRRDSAEHLRKKLLSLRAPVLGIVANSIRGTGLGSYPRAGYYYTGGASNGAGRASSNGSASGVEPKLPEDVAGTA